MERQLAAHLGAARLILEQVSGGPTHKSTSRLQAAAIIELIGQTGSQSSSEGLQRWPPTFLHSLVRLRLGTRGKLDLSAEARAKLNGQVLDIKWADDDAARVLDALVPPAALQKRRRGLQVLCVKALVLG